MNMRRVYINVAFFAVLFGIMVFWLTNAVITFRAIDRPYRISAEFSNAFGVLPNSEVTYLGVTYGQVDNVERIPGGVRVDMLIRRDHGIPAGSEAWIFRKSAIGEQYVDFAPPPGPIRSYYPDGTVLSRDQTHVPLEFSEMLRSASALIGSIPPDAVGSLIDELAEGLEGRADSFRQLVEGGDRLGQMLADRTEALDRLAENNTRLTRVFTEHRGSFGQSLTDLREVADSLRNARHDLTALLDRGGDLLGVTADLVARHKGNLDCIFDVVDLLLDETTSVERLHGLAVLLEWGPRSFDAVWDARDVDTEGPHPGVWVRVGFVANPLHNPPRQYTPPRPVPTVRSPSPCDSPLRSAGPDYVPSPRSGSLVATTGLTGGAMLALVLLGSFAVLRLSRP